LFAGVLFAILAPFSLAAQDAATHPQIITMPDGTRALVTSDVTSPDGTHSMTMKGLKTPPQVVGETTRLYMLSITNGSDYTALLRADAQGNYETVRVIETPTPSGKVLEDQDLGMLVDVSESPTLALYVIDMKSPSQDRVVAVPDERHDDAFHDLLNFVHIPGSKATLALISSNVEITAPRGAGARMIPKDSHAISLDGTDRPVSTLPSSALENLRVGGTLGESPMKFDVKIVDGQQQLDYILPSGRFPSGLPRPPREMGKKEGTSFLMYATNDSIAVAGPIDPGTSFLEVYTRSSKQWNRFPTPFTFQGVRVFGKWIALTSARPKEGLTKNSDQAEILRLPSSPGSEKRKTELAFRLYSVDDNFTSSPLYFPGDLAVINGLTGQTFRIHTGQGDSEVLLVDQTSIFYRVNDQIFQSEMKGNAVSEPVKVVEGPEIVQVHWAFRPR
jgi:hypothetical protein